MTVYVVDLEAVDTRYTAQWKKHLPLQLKNNTDKEVVVISGGETPQTTTRSITLPKSSAQWAQDLRVPAEQFSISLPVPWWSKLNSAWEK